MGTGSGPRKMAFSVLARAEVKRKRSVRRGVILGCCGLPAPWIRSDAVGSPCKTDDGSGFGSGARRVGPEVAVGNEIGMMHCVT
jgi:hypothetical protein